MIDRDTVKAWLKSKRVAVWPTVTKDLTDEHELEEAAIWLQGQVADLLDFAGIVIYPVHPSPLPPPTLMDHEYALVLRAIDGGEPHIKYGPPIEGCPGSGAGPEWSRVADMVDIERNAA